MKKFKSLKLMLLGLLAMGSANTFAQTYVYSTNGLDYQCTLGTPNTAVVMGVNKATEFADKTEFTIPATIKAEGTGAVEAIAGATFNVTGIMESAFKDKTGITSITISGTNLTEIGDSAFYNAGITAIALPKTVISIGGAAFENSKIASFTWAPASSAAIGVAAFKNTQLTAFTIPANVTTIPDSCFMNSAALATLTITKNVASVGKNFIKGTAIETLDFTTAAAKLTTLADSCFASSTLKSVVLTKNTAITTIEDGFFLGATAVSSIAFPTTLTAIEKYALKDTKLVTLDLSKTNVTQVENWFKALKALPYSSLTSVKFKDNASTYLCDSAFAHCTKLNNVVFPTKWTAEGEMVEAYAFENCTSLKTVTFMPATVSGTTSVFDFFAFNNCSEVLIETTEEYYNAIGGYTPLNAYYNFTAGVPVILNGQYAMLCKDFEWSVPATDAVAYSLYVDNNGDGTIYLIPYRVDGGMYTVAASEAVVLKVKNNSYVEDNKTKYNIIKTTTGGTTQLWPSDLQRTTADKEILEILSQGAATDKYLNIATINNGVFGFTSPSSTTIAKGTYYVISDKQYGAANAPRIVWMDEEGENTTAIIEKLTKKANDGVIYNMQGVRVSNASQKGVYIMNGKKFIVK